MAKAFEPVNCPFTKKNYEAADEPKILFTFTLYERPIGISCLAISTESALKLSILFMATIKDLCIRTNSFGGNICSKDASRCFVIMGLLVVMIFI